MAAYAALVSVMHNIERINQPSSPPNSLDKTQLQSLSENVSFLQDFLERYSHDGSEEADELESRIRDAAHAAEDVIESHIVDQIAAGSSTSTHAQKRISFLRSFFKLLKVNKSPQYKLSSPAPGSIDHLYQDLEKVIQDLALIGEDVMAVKEKRGIINIQINTNSSVLPADSLISSPSMVGFDDLLIEIMDTLTGGQLDRQLIPIYGMGGMGKTTLARSLFIHEIVVCHFYVLAWVTISQEYSVRDILLEVINPENKDLSEDKLGEVVHKHLYGKDLREVVLKLLYGKDLSEDELGEVVHKLLYGRRYLIVMDDMWVIDVWDKVKRFFPDNNNGSRILITTRQSNVAFQLSETHSLKMNDLNKDESWELLCKNIFGEEGCPPELEKTGREIAENCRGLPLSIIVISRVLAKSKQTQEYWKYIAENLSSIVNLEDNAHCLKILRTSYDILPVHLKPCFLYMGIFKEDSLIYTETLINLWVGEGFLKSTGGKSLEEIARENLKDLADRNLIVIESEDHCSIHDLFRDICLKQSEREKFYCITSQSESNILPYRRIVARGNTYRQTFKSLKAMPLVRSLIYDFDVVLPSPYSRLLRILSDVRFNDSLEALFSQLINSRYLDFSFNESWISNDTQLIPSSLYLLWNVHTLIVQHDGVLIAPCEIWKMPQLRHVEFSSLELPDPPHMDDQDDFVLGNLHTLWHIKNFRCSEEVVKRIPNIKKLGVLYDGIEECSLSCFDNFHLLDINLHLLEIESLYCEFSSNDLLQLHNFPHSLKRLTLSFVVFDWEDITTRIGSLPLLQELELQAVLTRRGKWETVEKGFLKLKILKIGWGILKCWISERTHFPKLECISLTSLKELDKIPSDLGNIPTLKSIDMYKCSHSVVLSAKEIIEEQEELGNEDIQVTVYVKEDNEEVKSLQSHNFKVVFVQ